VAKPKTRKADLDERRATTRQMISNIMLLVLGVLFLGALVAYAVLASG
jgi:hypothetical protein